MNSDLFARHKNHTEFPVEISLSFYKKDEETFVIAFTLDITEQKKHEESIPQLNHDLEKRWRNLTK